MWECYSVFVKLLTFICEALVNLNLFFWNNATITMWHWRLE